MFVDLEVEYELESGSVLTAKINLVLSNPPYSTHRARGQSNFAHDVFPKNYIDGAVRTTGSLMDLEALGYKFCFGPGVLSLEQVGFCGERRGRGCTRDSERRKNKISEMFKENDRALLFIKRPAVSNRDAI